MKKRHHVYRNIIASLLILFSVAGIVLMCLDLTGIISDGLGRIDTGINDGPETDAEKAIKKQVVFTFKSDYNGAIYFRNESTGDYNANKRNFSSAKAYSGNSPISPLRYYFEKEKTLNPKTFHVSVTIQKRPNRELVPYGALNEDLFSKDYTNDCYILNRGQKEAREGYETDFISQQEEDNLPISFEDPDVAKAEQDYSKYVYDTYTTISPSLKESLLAYMKENELDNYSTHALPNALKNYFSKFLYKRPDYQVPAKEDIILHFLQEKYGVCNNFASATVMMLRAKGIPARFVTGYLGKSIQDEECPVTEEAAHAWTEYYIEGYGWKYIDTTSSRLDIDIPNVDDIDDDGISDFDNNNIDSGGEGMKMTLEGGISQGPLSKEELNSTVFTYNSDLDGPVYFRYQSLGNYSSAKRSFLLATLYGGYSNISPMRFNWEKEKDSGTMNLYHVSYSMKTTFTNSLIPVGSQNDALFPSDATNDNLVKNTNSKVKDFETDFYNQKEEGTLGSFSYEGTKTSENSYARYVRKYYTNISLDLERELLSYMASNGIDGYDANTLPNQLVEHFSSFTYGRLTETAPEGEDIILYFLNQKRGICSNFASATVMMLRAKGIPARYVTGFLGKGKKNTLTEVGLKSAHAWTEYYVQGSGWKMLETTVGGLDDEEEYEVNYHVLDPENKTDFLTGTEKTRNKKVTKPTNDDFAAKASHALDFKNIVLRLEEADYTIEDCNWYVDSDFTKKVVFPYTFTFGDTKLNLYGKPMKKHHLTVKLKEGASLSYLYNGRRQKPDLNSVLEIQGSLFDGDSASFSYDNYYFYGPKDAGKYYFSFELVITRENPEMNMTDEIIYYGSSQYPQPDNDYYDVTYDDALLQTSFEIRERQLTICYSGSAIASEPSSADVSLINTIDDEHSLADGDYISDYTFSGQGSCVQVKVTIKNQEGSEVTSNYIINYEYNYSEDADETINS